MTSNNGRLKRERETIEVMIKMYCKHHHSFNNELCEKCKPILTYAFQKIDRCVFGHQKPVCNNCVIHCYVKDMRNKVKEIMRYSGPRMMFHYPYLGIMHLIDKRKYINTKPDFSKKSS
jgi:hypothetical protein